jgi:branched-subunit amino acid transport protein
MTDNLWQVVLLMGAVTYIPRMLPFVLLRDMDLPPRVSAFMRFIPCAALSALVFPKALYSAGSPESAAAGCAVSVVLALLRLNIMVVVLGGIAGVVAWGILAA